MSDTRDRLGVWLLAAAVVVPMITVAWLVADARHYGASGVNLVVRARPGWAVILVLATVVAVVAWVGSARALDVMSLSRESAPRIAARIKTIGVVGAVFVLILDVAIASGYLDYTDEWRPDSLTLRTAAALHLAACAAAALPFLLDVLAARARRRSFVPDLVVLSIIALYATRTTYEIVVNRSLLGIHVTG